MITRNQGLKAFLGLSTREYVAALKATFGVDVGERSIVATKALPGAPSLDALARASGIEPRRSLDRLIPERPAPTLTLAKPTPPAEPPPQPAFHYRWASPWEVPDDVRTLAERAAIRAGESLGIHYPLDIRWVSRSGASKAQITLTERLLAWTPATGKTAWFCIDAAVPQQRIVEAVAHECHHISQRWAGKSPSEEAAARWSREFADKWRRGAIG